MQDSNGVDRLKLLNQITRLEFDYDLIQLCVQFLSKAHSETVINILRKHIRVTGKFDPTNRDEYFSDLQVIITRAQRLIAEIENKKAEVAILDGKDKGPDQLTRKHFDRLITQVSIFAKFHIDKKTVMVSEFVEYYSAMRESYEAMEKEYQKMKRA